MDPAVLRIVDVNLNRAREALRVVEDHARFALDDRDAAATAKSLRHEIAGIAARIGPAALLAARDILADVGRDEKHVGELARADADAVLHAALGRAAEAARSISEYAKLDNSGAPHAADASRAAENIRYRVYELEQRLRLRGAPRARFRAVRLYVIVTESLCRRPWIETAEAALVGGATCIQLREKRLSDAELLRRAALLRAVSDQHGALLILNDRPDLARLAGADGVHVGQDDVSVAQARSIAGPRMLIGRSTHTREQIDAALADPPDYLAVGPMFPTATKPQEHIAGEATLRYAAGRTAAPVVAIGGITAATAGALKDAGASAICVCAAVIAAADPAAAARGLCEQFVTEGRT
ncbi:MAG: thiamine phosphate synthase [Phycisphaerae bacterium]